MNFQTDLTCFLFYNNAGPRTSSWERATHSATPRHHAPRLDDGTLLVILLLLLRANWQIQIDPSSEWWLYVLHWVLFKLARTGFIYIYVYTKPHNHPRPLPLSECEECWVRARNDVADAAVASFSSFKKRLVVVVLWYYCVMRASFQVPRAELTRFARCEKDFCLHWCGVY